MQSTDRPRVVVVTGAEPYFGGSTTWAPLQAALPDVDLVSVDLIGTMDLQSDLRVSARRAIANALPGARAIVAHNTAAPLAIEAVAALERPIPVLLLSPMLARKRTTLMRVVGALLGGPLGVVLNRYAQVKRLKLLADNAAIRMELTNFLMPDHITPQLIDEARTRIADPRMDAFTARAAEVARNALTPVDPNADAAVRDRVTLVGGSLLDRKMAQREPAIMIPDVWSAPMIEAPTVVAEHLTRLLA